MIMYIRSSMICVILVYLTQDIILTTISITLFNSIAYLSKYLNHIFHNHNVGTVV